MINSERVKLGRQAADNSFIRFDYEPEVSSFRKCTGYWFDKINNILTGEITEIGHDFNIIVDSIGKLAAAKFRDDPAFKGIQMWAIGTGANTWDTQWNSDNSPASISTATQLVNEIGRLPINMSYQDTSIVYVDQEGNPTTTLTNRILVRRQFGRHDVNGEWREFAIFGGNATEVRNSGIMINHKIHRVINKTADMTVERNIIFTFN